MLVVEDESLLRDLICTALTARGFDVASAASPVEAARQFRAIDPDGIVMDINLGPGPDGFDLAQGFLEEETGVAIVFLTNMPDPRFAGRSATDLPSGIAYLRKGAVRDVGVLVRAVDGAIRGEVDPGMRHDRDPRRPLASLTPAQVELLRLIAMGKTNQQIAEIRGTTVKAVERMVTRACTALGVDEAPDTNRRVQAARRFIDLTRQPLRLAEETGQ